MNSIKKIIRSEKGSVVVYVLVTMLILVGILTVNYMQIQNKVQAQNKNIDKIEREYSQASDYSKMEEIYKQLQK